ncbi:vascular endothelial growth factor C-like isoform X1 [Anabas testudineus]|uniref:Platelet-derived growth factor (PDGF) family profile domain-containing protein n=1 Tax=Anabas testudineus TaxID=64144 RepID=A0A3Q1IUJ5_ANATE|nr:vascular endothelial growth factor C-like isoform X1 [Anabas testudineus]
MWIPALLLWMLNISNLCSGQDYTDYYQTGDMGTEAPVLSDDQPSLETVTSVDQLLQLLYPEYSVLQHCLRRESWHASSSSSPSFSASSANPLTHTNDANNLWGQPREEALYKVDGTLDVILEEIQRTSCQPREVCVEVAKEYPESTSQFYLPRCVALHRCGGCCTNEAFYCTNTSHTLVNKTLMELSPPRMDRVMVTFINHTSCECLSKRPLHSIIRRAAADHLCSPPDVPCASGSLWDPVNCMCVSADAINYSERETEALDSGLLALCGPNRVLQDSTCECVCRNGLTEDSCDPGWKLDHKTCECQCEGQGMGKRCPSGQQWNEDLCGCVCAANCPRNQPLNPDTCLCECRENTQSCLLQGKKFNRNTCSCYRFPCRKPRRVCLTGFYYSEQVCQCIPNYMRPEWN